MWKKIRKYLFPRSETDKLIEKLYERRKMERAIEDTRFSREVFEFLFNKSRFLNDLDKGNKQ